MTPDLPEPATSAAAYYENCDAARDAGAAPLRRGEPGYRDELDRDGDGVACEPYAGP
ncbi:excalibur calcium-binding domain-containing protein [Streptomyces sp. NPDC058671]|uniref:excalibur calcium-binding domain-containing protein n=1 Tax=Streptomyces sp. NPDC058671 TaxID=3346590 RepID=UPI00365DDCC7